MELDPLLLIILALSVVWVSVFHLYKQRNSGHLPPGPPQKFLSGNIHQLPKTEPWKKYAEWAKEYGPIFHVRVFSRHIIVLNTSKAVTDLLESRSSIYSERPIMWMYGELLGRKRTVFQISSENPLHKTYRKLLRTGLDLRSIRSYQHLFERENLIMLRALYEKPEDFIRHIRRNAGGIILEVAYGWTVKKDDDYFISLIQEGFRITGMVTRPGAFPAEHFPFLRFIPSWMPGGRFRKQAAVWRKTMSDLGDVPHEWVKSQMESGDYIESFTSKMLLPDGEAPPSAEEEENIKFCAEALYAGGADTTVAAMTAFFLLMAKFPSSQRQAQAELSQVVGDERLPNWTDQDNLPYVRALIQETLRWASVAPLGLPHSVTRDDVYQGYHIPKGSTVVANIWALMHDPDVYPDPDTFEPERYLQSRTNTPQPDPRKYVFGFGARVCPGSQFAEQSLFLSISSVLATFDVAKCTSETGFAIEPEVDFTTGVTRHIKPFEITITPRKGSAGLRLVEAG
ncbi:cytochrome P450 [Stereum hirsutum FP-91666 SS1]|uniref:cytochrome P450 n=1 Tax=Stereum hirsutum (strain FP-91666) TaxID=721885 RepID=UPI00044499D1|nr:cytochrome P450 [Stereum hirsutum FP-91666 SS1]EIM80788.1 cytochrome P450 [Stereum hirsutum FP-91666 SS1]